MDRKNFSCNEITEFKVIERDPSATSLKKILKTPSFLFAAEEVKMWKKSKESEVLSPTRITRAKTRNYSDESNQKSSKKSSSSEYDDASNFKTCMICFESVCNCVLMECGHGGN